MSKKVDYSKSIIYKLCCKDPNVTEIYVGSTINFKSRKNQHKTTCNNNSEKNKFYNFKVYKFIRDNGGFQNWTMIMLEQYNCENKKQLEMRERYWIEKLKPTLNNNIPTRTKKEWDIENNDYYKQHYLKNQDKLKQYQKQYYLNNKDKILEEKKQYDKKNQDKLKEYNKQYRLDNQNKIKEYQKQYRLAKQK